MMSRRLCRPSIWSPSSKNSGQRNGCIYIFGKTNAKFVIQIVEMYSFVVAGSIQIQSKNHNASGGQHDHMIRNILCILIDGGWIEWRKGNGTRIAGRNYEYDETSYFQFCIHRDRHRTMLHENRRNYYSCAHVSKMEFIYSTPSTKTKWSSFFFEIFIFETMNGACMNIEHAHTANNTHQFEATRWRNVQLAIHWICLALHLLITL